MQGLDLGNPRAAGVEWSFNGAELKSEHGVNVSDASLSFSDVRRNQSGEYSARLSNTHGNVTANFTIDVICEFEFSSSTPILCMQDHVSLHYSQIPRSSLT